MNELYSDIYYVLISLPDYQKSKTKVLEVSQWWHTPLIQGLEDKGRWVSMSSRPSWATQDQCRKKYSWWYLTPLIEELGVKHLLEREYKMEEQGKRGSACLVGFIFGHPALVELKLLSSGLTALFFLVCRLNNIWLCVAPIETLYLLRKPCDYTGSII